MKDDDIVKHDTKYLSYERSVYFNRLIAKFRLQSNRLEVIRGRYSRPSVPKPARICKSCTLEVDDEIHFATRCPTLNDIRTELFSEINKIYPNFSNLTDAEKISYLLNPTNAATCKELGLFIHKAKQLRQF